MNGEEGGWTGYAAGDSGRPAHPKETVTYWVNSTSGLNGSNIQPMVGGCKTLVATRLPGRNDRDWEQ